MKHRMTTICQCGRVKADFAATCRPCWSAQVASIESRTRVFWSRVERTDGCWLWRGNRASNGYGRYSKRPAHRYAWELTNGPIPDGLLVCHHCDTPLCVRPDHLFLGTVADNMADAARKGRMHLGESHPMARLTEAKVRDIRRLASVGARQKDIAALLNVSDTTIYNVLRGKSWRHVA